MVLPAQPGRQDRTVQMARKEFKACKVLSVRLARRVLPALRAWARRARRVLESQVRPDLRALQVLRVQMAPPARLARRVSVRRDRPDLRALVRRVLRELPAPMVQRA